MSNNSHNKPLLDSSVNKQLPVWRPDMYRDFPGELGLARVKELIEKGHDVNIVGRDGFTALMLVIAYGDDTLINHKIVTELLNHGADPNIGMHKYEKKTALMYALKSRTVRHDGWYNDQDILDTKHDIVLKLLMSGADVNATDEDGKTPLMFAVKNYEFFLKTIKLLCFFGANNEIRDKNGLTALDHLKSYYELIYKDSSYETPIVKFLKTGCNQPKEGGKMSRRKRNKRTRKINHKKKSRV